MRRYLIAALQSRCMLYVPGSMWSLKPQTELNYARICRKTVIKDLKQKLKAFTRCVIAVFDNIMLKIHFLETE